MLGESPLWSERSPSISALAMLVDPKYSRSPISRPLSGQISRWMTWPTVSFPNLRNEESTVVDPPSDLYNCIVYPQGGYSKPNTKLIA